MEPKDLPMVSHEELLAVVTERQRQLAEWRASHEALRAEIGQLTRGGTRQAAPFAKGSRVVAPKPPGRQPGTGTFRFRAAPPPEAMPQPPVDVLVLREACPTCGGLLEEARGDCAYRTALAARPRPPVSQ